MEPDPAHTVFSIPELLAHILGFLEPEDLMRARAVCRRWRGVKIQVRTPECITWLRSRVVDCVSDGNWHGLEAALGLGGRALAELLATEPPFRQPRGLASLGLSLDELLAAAELHRKAELTLRASCTFGGLRAARWLSARLQYTAADAR